jgi:hypothetical protein
MPHSSTAANNLVIIFFITESSGVPGESAAALLVTWT